MTANFDLAWAILFLPILGFLLLSLFGSRLEKALGRRTVGALAVLPMAGAFMISALITKQLAGLDPANRIAIVHGVSWIDLLGLKIPFELTIDPLSMTMALIITGVGSLIFLYSTGYMAEEREYSRFFTYMNLFAASMLLLVLANNLPLLFVGWEGVGLCSYLLIGFWYKDLANARAANKAFIVNRIGDWGLMLGIFLVMCLMLSSTQAPADGRLFSFDHIRETLSTALMLHPMWTTAAGLLLFVGAAGKSAQFPLYLWLPDAMAGPTPVSALIHAATMVTSGVVLLNRMHVVYEQSPVASSIVCGIGAFTALYAAVIAFGQTDIKKVLAYSTVSQLGFMFIGCGSGAYWTGMFHVTTHAFFKALLFLGAGAVIHAMSHNQDLRNYGNLRKYMPITTATMLIGWLAISAVGIPGLFGFAGFYSKESIIGAAVANNNASFGDIHVSMISGWLGLFVALLTAAYMTRLTWLTFFGPTERWREMPAEHGHDADEHALAQNYEVPADTNGFYHESPLSEEVTHDHPLTSDHTPKEVPTSMWFPLVVLAFLSVFSGWVLSNGDLLKNWLNPISRPGSDLAEPPSELHLGWISLVAALLGIVFGIVRYSRGLPKSEGLSDSTWSPWRLSARRQFGFDDGATEAAVQGGGMFAYSLWKWFDFGIVDGIVNGLAALSGGLGKGISSVQRGLVRSYALLMLLGGVAIIGYMVLGVVR